MRKGKNVKINIDDASICNEALNLKANLPSTIQ